MILELVGGDEPAREPRAARARRAHRRDRHGAGATAEVDFGLLMRERGRIHGSTLRARTAGGEGRRDPAPARGTSLPLLADGRVDRARSSETFPLDQAQEAYDAFAAGGKFGKIVIVP